MPVKLETWCTPYEVQKAITALLEITRYPIPDATVSRICTFCNDWADYSVRGADYNPLDQVHFAGFYDPGPERLVLGVYCLRPMGYRTVFELTDGKIKFYSIPSARPYRAIA